MLKSIIADWDDEQAIAILRTCRAAMSNGGKLLLAEFVLKPGNEPDPAKMVDLNMMVMNGGRVRTADDFGRLFTAAGFLTVRRDSHIGPVQRHRGHPGLSQVGATPSFTKSEGEPQGSDGVCSRK